MITEQEFIKNCRDSGVCGPKHPWKYCQFYEKCSVLRKRLVEELSEKDYNTNNYPSILYKEFVRIWRKEKLEKLLK